MDYKEEYNNLKELCEELFSFLVERTENHEDYKDEFEKGLFTAYEESCGKILNLGII